MYLLINEDGLVRTTEDLDPDLIENCDEGILTIIDISDPEDPREYIDPDWSPIEPAE